MLGRVRRELLCGSGLTYSWQIADGGVFGGPFFRSAASFMGPFSGCNGETLSVTFTVSNGSGSGTTSEPVTLPLAGPGPSSYFDTTVTGCDVFFDAGCSSGSIVSHDWVIDDSGAFGGPFSRSGSSFTESFPGCDAETLDVTLTVSDGALTDASNQNVTLPAAVTACFNAAVVGCTVTLDASCSSGPIIGYSWLIDDGGAFGGPRTPKGANVVENFSGCSGEALIVTLTVDSGYSTDSKLDTVVLGSGSVSACFVYVGKLNSCIHEWDASCSSGPITSYEWRVDTTAQLPPGTLNFNNPGPNLVVDWNSLGGCSGAPFISVELRVHDGGGGSDTITQSGFKIDQRSPDTPSRMTARLTGQIFAGSPTARWAAW